MQDGVWPDGTGCAREFIWPFHVCHVPSRRPVPWTGLETSPLSVRFGDARFCAWIGKCAAEVLALTCTFMVMSDWPASCGVA